MTNELENDIDYRDSIPPKKSRLAAFFMAAFVIILILALLATLLIGKPQGDRYHFPTIEPTLNPTYKNGNLVPSQGNRSYEFSINVLGGKQARQKVAVMLYLP